MKGYKEEKLENIIKDIIEQEGPITFARFMELALYYPDMGYYTGPGEKIGPGGDFYTSPDVHHLFGSMLAEQFHQMWIMLGKPSNWDLVEFGAGKGLLARDVLIHMRNNYSDAFQSCRYHIIEISPFLAARQKEELQSQTPPFNQVSWSSNIIGAHLNEITGCIFSNELVDSFPVHRIKKTPKDYKEIYVNYYDGRFIEEEGQLSTADLRHYLDRLEVNLETGQTFEINLAARTWLREIAKHLAKGFLLTIDYGMETKDLLTADRFNGTLRCYHKHRLVDNSYHQPGQQDITAHVNFSDLQLWGEEAGLTNLGMTSQMNFLLNLGILEHIKQTGYTFDEAAFRTTQAVKKLIMPEGMGRIFKVLIQSKGVSPKPELMGLTGPYKSRN